MDKQLLGTQLKDLFESLGVDIDDPMPGMTQEKYQAPKASFADDPLALSCASYRLYKEDPHRRFTNIDTVNATQEDRVQAQAIRDYYNQRYTMRVLKGGQLTEYQQKAAQFLSGLHHLTTEELGLLYKLPYFYEEDRALEQVVAQTISTEFRLPHLSEMTEYTLTPVVEIFKSRKGGEFVEFVYRDQNNHAVMMIIRASDNMVAMLRGLFRQPSIRVQGHSTVVKLDTEQDHNVRKLTMWELVF
jgi:hypothetical protein